MMEKKDQLALLCEVKDEGTSTLPKGPKMRQTREWLVCEVGVYMLSNLMLPSLAGGFVPERAVTSHT